MADARTARIEVMELGDRSLREHTARGTLINASFQIGLALIGLSRRFLIAIFLTAADYGLWGLIYTAVASVLALKDVGIGDKYIQQDDEDQEAAFQRAFTLEVIWCAVFAALIMIGMPLFAVIYGQPEIVLPGCIMAFAVLVAGFQTPSWVFYRRMQFVRQRALLAIEPILGFIVTMALGAAGLGYWSLVIGLVVGSSAAAIACVIYSPYRLRFRLERGVMRDYFDYSWPLVIAAASGVIGIQAAVITGEATIGLAGVGAIGLAGSISSFADRADIVVSQALYPAVCAVKDRMDLLFESFTKSNRLALIWGMPFGLGLSLFAPDVITYVLGEKWSVVEPLLIVFGIVCGIQQLAFNWSAYFKALNDTRPIAVHAFASLIVYVAVLIPGMILWGLTGFAIAICTMMAVQILVRAYYLGRLFHGFKFLSHSFRAIAPSLPAVGAVLAVRQLETGPRTLGMVFAELALYMAITMAATWRLERALVREIFGYLRAGRRTAQSPA